MQAADLPEFEELLGQLCAGYEVPLTKARRDAQWAGCRKMSIIQYRRCVEFALGEEGPEDFPAPKAMWKILRSFRDGARPAPAQPEDTRDHLAFWANRLLYAHIAARGGLASSTETPSAELAACLKLKRELIDWFLSPIRDGDPDVTPAEFLRQWIAGLQSVSRIEPVVYARWCEMLELPEYQSPFEPFMARELEPEQRSSVPA